jgi:hypothetical protein
LLKKPVMHVITALVLFAHGLSHLVGFLAGWHLTSAKIPPITTLLWGHVQIGEVTRKIVGSLWLLLALAFCVAAMGALLRLGFWPRFTQVVAIMSLALCLLEGPDTEVGLVVNLAILGILSFAIKAGWQLTG